MCGCVGPPNGERRRTERGRGSGPGERVHYFLSLTVGQTPQPRTQMCGFGPGYPPGRRARYTPGGSYKRERTGKCASLPPKGTKKIQCAHGDVLVGWLRSGSRAGGGRVPGPRISCQPPHPPCPFTTMASRHATEPFPKQTQAPALRRVPITHTETHTPRYLHSFPRRSSSLPYTCGVVGRRKAVGVGRPIETQKISGARMVQPYH